MKRLISILMLAFMVTVGQAAEPVYYDLSVGGKTVTDKNASDIMGDGYFSYDVSTNTLTVKNGAKLTSTRGIIYNYIENLTIKFLGNADLTSDGGGSPCISMYKPTKIIATKGYTVNLVATGSSVLHVYGTDLTIGTMNGGCTINLTGAHGISGYINAESTLKLTGYPTLNIVPQIYALEKLTSVDMGNCKVAIPVNGTVKPGKNGNVYDCFGNGLYGKNVTITHKDNILNYGLYVAGIPVTNWNADDIKGSTITNGKVSFDTNTKTLTLDNVNVNARYQEERYNGINCSAGYLFNKLNVNLVGENRMDIQDGYVGLSLSANTAFSGSGSLQVTTGINFYKEGTLEFLDGCTVEASKVIGSNSTSGQTLKVNNATVTAHKGIQYFNACTLTKVGFYSPEGGSYDTDKQSVVTKDGESYTSEVIIKPKVDYGIIIGGVEVTNWNADDIKGDNILGGEISFNADWNTLTLKDAIITCTDKSVGLRSTRKDLRIGLVGTNTITTNAFSAMSFSCDGENLLCGYGKLNVKSSDGFGIYVGSNSQLTIADHCRVNAEGDKCGIGSNNGGRYAETLHIMSAAQVSAKVTGYYSKMTAITGLAEITLGWDTGIQIPEGGQIKEFTSSDAFFPGTGIADSEGKLAKYVRMGMPIDIQVAGVKVDYFNAANITGEGITGHVSYDYENYILTLDHATIDAGSAAGIETSNLLLYGDTLRVLLIGDNTINSDYFAILKEKGFNDLKIYGNGTLTTNSQIHLATGSMEIAGEGCTVKAPSLLGASLYYSTNSFLTIDQATVKLSEGLTKFNDVLLEGVYITSPSGAYYDTRRRCLVDEDGNQITTGCLISPKEYLVTLDDITLLIDRYLEPGSTVQLIDITNLIDRYLEQ